MNRLPDAPGQDDVDDDGLLGSEMPVEGHGCDVGGVGYLFDGYVVEPVRGEQVKGGVPDLLARGEFLARSAVAAHGRDCTKPRTAADVARTAAATAATSALAPNTVCTAAT